MPTMAMIDGGRAAIESWPKILRVSKDCRCAAIRGVRTRSLPCLRSRVIPHTQIVLKVEHLILEIVHPNRRPTITLRTRCSVRCLVGAVVSICVSILAPLTRMGHPGWHMASQAPYESLLVLPPSGPAPAVVLLPSVLPPAAVGGSYAGPGYERDHGWSRDGVSGCAKAVVGATAAKQAAETGPRSAARRPPAASRDLSSSAVSRSPLPAGGSRRVSP